MLFVSFARPTTASSSMNMASVMPFLRAAAGLPEIVDPVDAARAHDVVV
jgi:hypothetical protein